MQTLGMEPISRHLSVRRGYDAVAKEYAAAFRDELATKPLDRALLACLAEQAEHGAPVADLGCGPGHVAAWLAERGVAAVGIDVSRAMVAIGRSEYPQVEFREGDLLQLPGSDGEFGAAIAFYSIIHLEPSELGRAFGEVRRVLRPGGLFLVSFHAGSEIRHLDSWWGMRWTWTPASSRCRPSLSPWSVLASARRCAWSGSAIRARSRRAAHTCLGEARPDQFARR